MIRASTLHSARRPIGECVLGGVVLPTLTFLSKLVRAPRTQRGWLPVFFVFLLPVAARAQAPQATGAAPRASELLPARLGDSWRAVSAMRELGARETVVLPDGDLLAEYGLRKLTVRTYTNGKSQLSIEAFEMNHPSGAYGLSTVLPSGAGPGRKGFQLGRHYLRLSATPPSENLPEAALRQLLPAETAPAPVLPLHLPAEGKIAESQKYLLGRAAVGKLPEFESLRDVIDFTGGAEAAYASYPNGAGRMGLLLVEYHTPQLAQDGFDKLQAHLASLPDAEKSRRLVKRIGNYVVEAAPIEDPQAAQTLLGKIQYSQKVYWQGKKASDIPLEFRPADPAATQEALQTTFIIVRSFYWIGLMLVSAILVGFLAGGTLFYWNRYRKRKLGIEDVFSDAGGSVRLNLDDYLLDSPSSEIKQIGNRSSEP